MSYIWILTMLLKRKIEKNEIKVELKKNTCVNDDSLSETLIDN